MVGGMWCVRCREVEATPARISSVSSSSSASPIGSGDPSLRALLGRLDVLLLAVLDPLLPDAEVPTLPSLAPLLGLALWSETVRLTRVTTARFFLRTRSLNPCSAMCRVKSVEDAMPGKSFGGRTENVLERTEVSCVVRPVVLFRNTISLTVRRQ